MPDWLEEYRQRMEKSGEPISSRCSGVPVFSYNNINNNINNISSEKPGTPGPNAGVPGVPEKPEHQGREHQEHRVFRPVFPDLLNDINGRTPGTPGTPGTPPGDREGHTNNATTLPEPTLKVLARLREHFQAQGFHGVDLETLPLAALWKLCKLKGGPVAFPEDAKGWATLAQAKSLVIEVFGPEVAVEEA